LRDANGIAIDDLRRKRGIQQRQVLHGVSLSKTLGKTYAGEKGHFDEPPCPIGYHSSILDDEGAKTTGETLN
jgi:hypothetical protein